MPISETQPAIKRLLPIGPILSGILVFILLYGIRPLDPGDLNWWGLNPDGLQSWIGWTCFRNSPWSFPLGLSFGYGLDINNSIIYTDSIPLLAVVFKLFSSFIPNIFQYLGWWTLACFIFQAYFGWKLTTLCTSSYIVQWLGSLLYLISPIIFLRLNGHFTLVGQFLVLAALYLCLAPPTPKRYLQWLLLICLASWIHAYLTYMIVLIWLAWIAMQLFRYHTGMFILAKYVAITLFGLLMCCWVLGYFANTPGDGGGFGYYKMNIFSLFDSGGSASFLPDIPSHEGEYEGYNYLGAGKLFLLLICIVPIVKKWPEIIATLRYWWPLVLLCLILFAISLTYNVGIGPYSLHLPKLNFLEPWLQVLLRSSGRFFWPVHYLIIFCIISLIAKNFTPIVTICLLSVGTFLQIIDIKPLFNAQRVKDSELLSRYTLSDPLWNKKDIKEIRLLPFWNSREGWEKIGILAALNHIPTNHIYVSRLDRKALERVRKKEQEIIETGNFEPNVIYIVNDDVFKKFENKENSISARYIDGFPVIRKN